MTPLAEPSARAARDSHAGGMRDVQVPLPHGGIADRTPSILARASAEHSGSVATSVLASRQSAAVFTELYRTVDVAVVLLVLATVLVVSNVDRIPDGGVAEFLRLRVTLKNGLLVIVVAFAWQKLFFLAGLYDPERIAAAWREQMMPIIAACTIGCACAFALPLASSSGAFGYLSVGYVWLGVTVSTLLTRFVIRAIAVASNSRRVRHALVVGTGPRARLLEKELSARTETGYRVIGFVESNDFTPHPDVRERTIGTLDELEGILMHRVVDEVLIALPVRSCYERIQRVIEDCERAGVDCLCLADLFKSSLAHPRYDASVPFPAISMPATRTDHRQIVKRLVDLIGGVLGVIVVLPIMALIALIIKLTDGGPIVFAQQRIGFRKRPFRMFKFRTMVANAEALQPSLEHANEATGPVFKIRRDPRITRFGRFLRRTSLDELPQLFNVIRGEMSLVGPRPLPIRDVGHFSEPWLMRRFSVLPGLTCLWQIQGRSRLTFDDWVTLDLEYIDGWSLSLDLRILFKTIPAVLRGSGAS